MTTPATLVRKPRNKAPDLGTREALIEAYLFLCSRIGAGNVTFEKIAQQSGFSFGTVRYHFAGDQADITQSAILYVLQKGVAFLNEQMTKAKSLNGYDPLEAYVRTNFAWLDAHPTHSRFLLYYYYLCSTKVQLAASNQQYLQASRARIDDLLIEGVGRGLYPRGRGVEGLSTQIHSIVMGACLAAMIEGETAPGNRHERQAVQSLHLVVRSQLAEN